MGADDTPGDFIRQSRRIWSPTKIADIWHAEKSAVLNANRGGPRKSQSQHRAHLAIFLDFRLYLSVARNTVTHTHFYLVILKNSTRGFDAKTLQL